jgi:hypothetical protein
VIKSIHKSAAAKPDNPFINSYDTVQPTKMSNKNVRKSKPIEDRVIYTNQGWGVNKDSPKKKQSSNISKTSPEVNKKKNNQSNQKVIKLNNQRNTKFGPSKASFTPADDSDEDFNWV